MAKRRPTRAAEERVDASADVRIIGGKFRGSRLAYHGDPTTRPMKHRVREAIFNLLGTDIAGKHAVDLFAGTGALGLEALSRSAASATFIERHVPTARLVQENIERLGVADRCELLCTSAFLWAKQLVGGQGSCDDFRFQIASRRDFRLENVRPDVPWIVFCSPPYDFFMDRQAEMLELIELLLRAAPAKSVFVVESDERFDFNLLPTCGENDAGAAYRAPAGAWRMRTYPPAQIGVLR
jgi:16S rRNA (guanine966-N2)-methyltransferase